MNQVQTSRFQRTIGVLQIVIIALVVITALVHLQRGIAMSASSFGAPSGGAARPQGGQAGGFSVMQLMPFPMSTMFLLNGIGYLVLGAALYLPALARYQSIVRWLLILFTAVTVVMYFMIVGFRANPIGLIDKAVEVALIVLLFVDGRRTSRSLAVATPEMVPR